MNTSVCHGCKSVLQLMLIRLYMQGIHSQLRSGWARTRHFLWAEPGHSSHQVPLRKVQKPLERDLQSFALETEQLQEVQIREHCKYYPQHKLLAPMLKQLSPPLPRLHVHCLVFSPTPSLLFASDVVVPASSRVALRGPAARENTPYASSLASIVTMAAH